MQERIQLQQIPIKMYRTAEVLTIAAPMPGLVSDDISVEITAGDQIVLRGELRGVLKDVKDLLINEWSVGGYFRQIDLPHPVDGPAANVSYGNGVLVVALPISDTTRPAMLTLHPTGSARGRYTGGRAYAFSWRRL